jgi:aqualysin 1
VIDTGIYRHTDLYRVKHVNFVGDGRNTDCHGHGTHVVGTLAAKDRELPQG